MAARPERSDDPPFYPRDRSFGALLTWHVAWGTRAQNDTTERNSPWTSADLASLIHAPGTRPDTAKKSFQNWRNQGRLPEASDADKIERLFSELFGNAPALRLWKEDLRDALERDRWKTRAERKADAIAFRNEMMGVAQVAWQDEPASNREATAQSATAYVAGASDSEHSVYPDGYPRNGTYSELLNWHLRVWGTRPGCSLQEPNVLTDLSHFAAMTHEGIFWGRKSFMEENVNLWLSGEHPVSPYSITRVELELFGFDPGLSHWKIDLRDALIKADPTAE